MTRSIIVHGGAWDIPDDEVDAHMTGCRIARDVGWQVLLQGGSALDAVEVAVRSMEDDSAFDAGVGSVLNADGVVEMDAAMMDGQTLRSGQSLPSSACATRSRWHVVCWRAMLFFWSHQAQNGLRSRWIFLCAIRQS